MAYRIDGKDIVISGFQDGIADSPYDGISDMRNMDIISIPGEASVTFSTVLSSQTNIPTTTFTASNSGGDLLLTWAGGTTLPNNTAVRFTTTGNLPTGLVINKAYYVLSTAATTFKVALTATGSPIAYTDAGTGVQSFSTINMAQPKFERYHYYIDTSARLASYLYYMIDSMGRIWYYYQKTQWVYLNNLGGNEALAGITDCGNGLEAMQDYLIFFRTQNVGYIKDINSGVVQSLSYLTTSTNWVRTWKGLNNSNNYPIDVSHYAMLSPTDGNIYFCNGSFVGSLGPVPGVAFDPSGSSGVNYLFNESALALPSNDTSVCLNQLVTNLLIGGISNVVYSWDRISIGYNPILIAENITTRIVTVNTTAYFFSGQRGRIYICNGSQAELYKKMPDHLSGTTNPYYTWGDATYNRNQLYFGVQATTNAGVAINNYGGVWSVDVQTEAIRLVNQLSYGSYSGIASALMSFQGTPTSDGSGLIIGWYTSTNTIGGIDVGSSLPYSGGQSYVDSDLIPIGNFIDPFTPSQVEWKTSVPLGANGTSETVALYYRTNFNDSYSLIGTTSSSTGLLAGGSPSFSDMYQTNFQKAQWIQIRAVLTSNSTTPTYCRLTEIRVRDYPSGRGSK